MNKEKIRALIGSLSNEEFESFKESTACQTLALKNKEDEAEFKQIIEAEEVRRMEETQTMEEKVGILFGKTLMEYKSGNITKDQFNTLTESLLEKLDVEVPIDAPVEKKPATNTKTLEDNANTNDNLKVKGIDVATLEAAADKAALNDLKKAWKENEKQKKVNDASKKALDSLIAKADKMNDKSGETDATVKKELQKSVKEAQVKLAKDIKAYESKKKELEKKFAKLGEAAPAKVDGLSSVKETIANAKKSLSSKEMNDMSELKK